MKNGLRTVLIIMLTALLAMGVFAGGFWAGRFTTLADGGLPALAGLSQSGSGSGDAASRDALFAPFWEAWDLVHKNYVNQPVDDKALMQGAIRGMMAALGDDYSRYMTPEEYAIVSTDTSGELEGIGASVETAPQGGLLIVSPFPGSPAEAAGLKPSDRIIKVDDTDVTAMDKYKIIMLVRGAAGTAVHLSVIREGTEGVMEFDVVRAKIMIPSVESKMLDGQIAYVKLNDFGAHTTDELTTALKSLMAQKPAGLILDVRGNPGGFRDTAIEVASQFLPNGTLVMREQYADGKELAYKAKGGGLATDIPMIVLINKGSASASEIVAGALQDEHRATLLGETSFGKGSVQNWQPLVDDAGTVAVTIARWLTPSGRWIMKQGITPDVTVELTDADHAAGRDPQLDAAVQQLKVPASVQP